MAELPDPRALLEGFGSSVAAVAIVAGLFLVSLYISRLFLRQRKRRARPFQYHEDQRVPAPPPAVSQPNPAPQPEAARPAPSPPQEDGAAAGGLAARLDWLESVLDEIREGGYGVPADRISEVSKRPGDARAGRAWLEHEVQELEREILALLPPLDGER